MTHRLDTHVLLWRLLDDHRLSTKTRQLINGRDAWLYVSSALVWGSATKFCSGRLQQAATIVMRLPALIEQVGLRSLSVTVGHAHRAGLLDGAHKDPFDRMIAAQAPVEELHVITIDPKIAERGAKVVW